MRRFESAFKKYLIMMSIGLGIAFVGSVFIYKLEKADVPTAEAKLKIQSEARNFSKNHTVNDCILEVQLKTKTCPRDDLSCMVASKIYLTTCLETPVSVKGFCEGFQVGDEPVKAESFSSVYCNSHHEIDIVVCRNVFDAVEDYCRQKISLK
jgi:hypothetical protein